jgi:tRNA pseudouridine(38-40) synthase
MVKKKYHKQYKSKKDAMQSYFRTVTEFKAEGIQEIMSQQMVRFSITGNSFAYNQIRKMLSSLVEVASMGGDIEVLKKSFDSKVMKHNNNVPAQGLILWRAYYDEYNSRARKNFEQGGTTENY